MISRVVNQASKTPRAIETSASIDKYSENISLSWMSSICWVREDVEERPLTVS